jgi:hypothetical protein
MKTILLGLMILLLNLSGFECAAQTSKIPKEMPDNTEIRFGENGGMLNAFTTITIAKQTITVEEKKGDEQKPRKWSAKIEKSEQEDLYHLFVENKFDTIKNDKRQGIVYDAGSEGISLNAAIELSWNVSYGPNSPLSGGNLERFQTIAKGIQDLRAKYEGKRQKQVDAKYVVLENDFGEVFKNASQTTLSEDEIAEIKQLIKTAVADHNTKDKAPNRKIENLEKYKFQFVPALNGQGEKEVYVNGFCMELSNWQTQIVFVDDGGSCFFQFYINLTKKTFDRFAVNGDA